MNCWLNCDSQEVQYRSCRWTLFVAVLSIASYGFIKSHADEPLLNPYSEAYRNPYGKLPGQKLPGDRMAANYFNAATKTLTSKWRDEEWNLERWQDERASYKQQLLEMLGLDPYPDKTELKSEITGVLDHPEFTVEKLHFQSRPGLYATANVYVPKNLDKPAPAILYVCGHGPSKIDGVSYGNKVSYQHHGAWFARNGYVCMILDTVQMGEIEGIHHGTHNQGMWWWNSRGYTSAGAEAWNCIRAIDYLQSRSDVDGERIGVTGRSGGGAYSWWVAALDERIRVACPVAGITDLQNHIIDGCVEGHCDCMYLVNTYRWDYFLVAGLVAPRPLLICNTDKDTIFPLDGVVRLHSQVRQFYVLYDAPDHLGLLITEGPHKDTQELQLPVMRWFNKWLKNDVEPVPSFAEKYFTPQQLKVFETLPSDEITSRCFEDFTELAVDSDTFSSVEAISKLRQKTFRAWPSVGEVRKGSRVVSEQIVDGVRFTVREFSSENEVNLRFYQIEPIEGEIREVQIELVEEDSWRVRLRVLSSAFPAILSEELRIANMPAVPGDDMAIDLSNSLREMLTDIREQGKAMVLFAPRGIGLSRHGGDQKYQTHLRRRYMLLGATLASSQVWDVLRCCEEIQSLANHADRPLHLRADREMTEVASFAAVFSERISSLSLRLPPRSDRESPDFLNWSRIVTPKQLRALVEQSTQLHVVSEE